MFRSASIAALIILFSSLGLAGDVITVSGKVSDAYSDEIHLYVEEKFFAIEDVPKDVIKKIQKMNREKNITLKIKIVDGKYTFLSLES